MKKYLYIIAFLAVLFASVVFAQTNDDTVTVTWNCGDAAYMITPDGQSSEKTSKFHIGHVITSSDLPIINSYASASDKYHSEWENAVGTVVTEDTQFNLVWKANYEGYKTVIWKSSVLPDFCIVNFYGNPYFYTYFFCDISIYPEGHVITKSDITAHSHYANHTGSSSYHYEWTGAEGTKVTENNTLFLYECIADDADSVTVAWYNTCDYTCIRPKNDYNENHLLNKSYGFISTHKKGHVLTDGDLPAILYEDDYLYYYTWDGAEGTVLNENTYFTTVQHLKETARVRMYLDDELVYDKELKTGTRIIMPKVIEGHEEMRIWGWSGGSVLGPIECDAGEEFEVNVNVVFDAKCVLWGDITHDGTTNTYDAVVVLKRIAQDKPFKILEKMAADMDENDLVNTRDAVLILKLVASK